MLLGVSSKATPSSVCLRARACVSVCLSVCVPTDQEIKLEYQLLCSLHDNNGLIISNYKPGPTKRFLLNKLPWS